MNPNRKKKSKAGSLANSWRPHIGIFKAPFLMVFSSNTKALKETAMISQGPHPMSIVWPEKADALMSSLFCDHMPKNLKRQRILANRI